MVWKHNKLGLISIMTGKRILNLTTCLNLSRTHDSHSGFQGSTKEGEQKKKALLLPNET
jgi:hypothetical protein